MNNVPADLLALAQEFQKLRSIRGHFSGGEWNDDVDKAGGRKEAVMAALGEKLGDGRHSKADVVAIMGAPDDVFSKGHALFGQAYRDADPRVIELLVYHWRGLHDFLFFASDGTNVLASGWWSAGE